MNAPVHPGPIPPSKAPIKLFGGFRPYVVHGRHGAAPIVPVLSANANVYGGFIVNPLDAKSQGVAGHPVPTTSSRLIGPVNTTGPNDNIPLNTFKWIDFTNPEGAWEDAEPLFISLVGPAELEENEHTVKILPGGWFTVPPGVSVWVNAATDLHQFTAVFGRDPAQAKPTPVPDSGWPPNGPTGLLTVLYAYLYQEYSDDDDLQEFVAVLNAMQQDYVDTFNALRLPVYPDDIIAGPLLDWVGEGVYGYPRPVVSHGRLAAIGPLNTWGPNDMIPVNTMKKSEVQGVFHADDDLYKRCLTWHLQKGDGKYFNIRWLKRRIMRFLIGVNGTTPHIDNTDQISVTLGTDNVAIRFVLGKRTVTGGAMPNRFGPNSQTPPNSMTSTYEAYGDLPYMNIFKMALSSGVLETPFQMRFTCVIG